ncbi:hypothetical protein LTR74_016539 [Friedmanniomyces endolithicus]|nr:hypothetical protein LTR74_016539 [Friedmanniomyces endolithicus]
MPAVSSGGGKALLLGVSLGENSGDDLVNYVKEVAGRKGDAQFQFSQQCVQDDHASDTWRSRPSQSPGRCSCEISHWDIGLAAPSPATIRSRQSTLQPSDPELITGVSYTTRYLPDVAGFAVTVTKE